MRIHHGAVVLLVLAASPQFWSQGVARGVAGRDFSHVKPLPGIEPGPETVHMFEFGREQLVKFTPLWKGERSVRLAREA